jgi:hypothetical protein
VKEFDIFIPLNYNDGTAVEGEKLQRLQRRLLEHFAGLTFFPQPNEGYWKLRNVTYRDEIVIYRVLASDAAEARAFLRTLKAELKTTLRQEEILIIERDVSTL